MSKGKYAPAVLAGIRNSGGHSLFQWPDDLPGVGRRFAPVPFTRCLDCPPGIHVSASGTFTTYGGRPLCLGCVRRRMREVAA